MGVGGGMNVPSLPGANSPDDRNKAKYPEGETVRFTTSQIPLAIDGILYDRDLADFLGWPTTDIESIELVDSKDSRSLWHKTYYGFIDIKTRSGMKTKDISADGLSFKPKGLAVPTKDLEHRMPSRPGNYRVIVDVVSPDRSIKTYVKKIELQ